MLVKVDRWFPSTKTCHACGTKNPDVKLGVSEWDCPSCGAHNDRDENAAVNIKNEGKRIFIEFFRQWLAEDEKAKDRAAKRAAARRKKKAA